VPTTQDLVPTTPCTWPPALLTTPHLPHYLLWAACPTDAKQAPCQDRLVPVCVGGVGGVRAAEHHTAAGGGLPAALEMALESGQG